VALKGEYQGAYSGVLGKADSKIHVEGLGVNGRIILKILDLKLCCVLDVVF
jgi:hypothetical protein